MSLKLKLVLLSLLLTAVVVGISGEKASAATFVVDDVGDATDAAAGNGACATAGAVCTLRAAITEANALAGTDTINFSIAGAGPHTISPATALPTITSVVTIDGSTEPGASCGDLVPALPSASNTPHTLLIEIDGSAITGGGIKLGAGTTGSIVRGLVINGFGAPSGYGVTISGGDSQTIECNYLGTNVAGTSADANASGGFFMDGTGHPDVSITNNLVSGNSTVGIFLGGAASAGSVISENIVGLNSAGTGGLGNTGLGIWIAVSATDVTINKNVISGNFSSGVALSTFFSSADGNTVTGNFIGTDLTGTADFGNGAKGIVVDTDDNTIGGLTEAERNVISGNTENGIDITGADNTVIGNYIGTDYSGTVALPNTVDGIRHFSLGPNTIGGFTDSARNIISGNGDDGVQFDSAGAAGNASVINNWIGVAADGSALGNGQIVAGSGIEIGWNDTGGNLIQNNVISANSYAGVLQFGLNSTGDTYFGNYIGTNALGEVESGYGNTQAGISIWFGTLHIIGGHDDGEPNIIAGNGDGGVAVVGNSENIEDFTGLAAFPGVQPNIAAEASIVGNSIYDNDVGGDYGSGLGIDLMDWRYPAGFFGAGPNDNDYVDPDSGANNFLNIIEVETASNDDGLQTVNFNLDVPSGDYLIEFYANDEADPSGYGEAQDLLYYETVSHSGGGPQAFTFNFSNPDTERHLSAVVTEDLGGGNYGVTSEISNTYPPVYPPALADTGSDMKRPIFGSIVALVSGFAFIVIKKRRNNFSASGRV